MKHKHKIILVGVMVLVIVGLIGTYSNFTTGGSTATARKYPAGQQKKEPTTADLHVERAADNKHISYSGFEGKNALGLLRLVGHVETQNFGEMGEFVKEIDGIKGDEKHFWAFYINGKLSDVGADKYQTKSTDKIEWKYEEIK